MRRLPQGPSASSPHGRGRQLSPAPSKGTVRGRYPTTASRRPNLSASRESREKKVSVAAPRLAVMEATTTNMPCQDPLADAVCSRVRAEWAEWSTLLEVAEAEDA